MDTHLKNLDILDGDTIRNIRLNNYFLDENKFENKEIPLKKIQRIL